jgi:hypothetical protein
MTVATTIAAKKSPAVRGGAEKTKTMADERTIPLL